MVNESSGLPQGVLEKLDGNGVAWVSGLLVNWFVWD